MLSPAVNRHDPIHRDPTVQWTCYDDQKNAGLPAGRTETEVRLIAGYSLFGNGTPLKVNILSVMELLELEGATQSNGRREASSFHTQR